ncbi:MAG TPA: Asp-tRNA(Asn)/Glu-tRNA(Gln) amidotransferase GatCAB subunit B, partial [Ruminiclostridium sp.]|nr:Asp-tRNA(Asn)/Glu-tRNA(Gln) amidotransferase GatCAB subunit B [Ruminiclostridium sp.]
HEAVAGKSDPKEAAKWIVGEMMRNLKDREIEPENIPFGPENLVSIISMCKAGKITAASGKKVLSMLFDEKGETAESLVEKHSLAVIGDEGAIDKTVADVIAANPKSVEDFMAGKEKAIGFLMGQCMKALHGKADPAMLREKLLKSLKANN